MAPDPKTLKKFVDVLQALGVMCEVTAEGVSIKPPADALTQMLCLAKVNQVQRYVAPDKERPGNMHVLFDLHQLNTYYHGR